MKYKNFSRANSFRTFRASQLLAPFLAAIWASVDRAERRGERLQRVQPASAVFTKRSKGSSESSAIRGTIFNTQNLRQQNIGDQPQ